MDEMDLWARYGELYDACCGFKDVSYFLNELRPSILGQWHGNGERSVEQNDNRQVKTSYWPEPGNGKLRRSCWWPFVRARLAS